MLRAVSRSFVRLAPARAPLRLGARCLVAQGSPPRLASDDEPDFDDDLLEEHPAIMRRIDAVRVLHERHSALCDELAEKVEALTLEYDAKLAPILARRADIVSGRSEPTDDEAKPLDAYMSKLSTPPGEAEPGIPGFWLTAITEHEALSDAVTEEDAPVLEYLQDVQCLKFRPGERTRATLAGGGGAPEEGKKRRSAPPEGVDELAGFELVFSFAPNPYFEEPVLRKVVWMDEGYPAATHASTIKWKQGKDVTHRVRASLEPRSSLPGPGSNICFTCCSRGAASACASLAR